jgi:hypothetical protein
MSRDEAFAILRERRGRMYDPAVVDLFMAVQDKLAAAAGLDVAGDSPAPVTAPRPSEIRRRAEPVAQISAGEPLARLLGDLLGTCLCVIYELDAKGAVLIARVARGPFAKEVIGHQLEIGRGVSGWACAHYTAVDDTDAVLDLGSVLSPESIGGLSCTSVPVKVGGHPAVIAVYGPRSEAAQRLAVVRSVTRYFHGTGAAAVASPVAVAS